jgi:surface carbohydrate biosynthesis protein
MEKKTIILTIEIGDRELVPKTLLALELVKQGFRVYMGSFRAIHEIHKKINSCVFFHKSSYRSRIRKYKKNMGAVVAILDEELGPAIVPSRMKGLCEDRCKAINHEDYDYIFTLGEGYRKRISELPNVKGIKILPYGWPRIDLWRREFKGIYEQRLNSIKDFYGNYLLFISSFGITTKSAFEYQLSVCPESEVETVKRSYEAYKSYVSLLKRLAEHYDGKIIIRPHTSESIEDWKKIFHEFDNVEVLREGDVTPWLLGAFGVLTYRSTVAIQAALNDIPVVQYQINDVDEKNGAVYRVSNCAETFEDVLNYLGLKNGASTFREANVATVDELLKDEIASLAGCFSASKIAEELSLIPLIPQQEIKISLLMKRASKLWSRFKYFEYKLKKKLFPVHMSIRVSRFEKLPNGVNRNEISQYIKSISPIIGLEDKPIKCTQVMNDLVSVEIV